MGDVLGYRKKFGVLAPSTNTSVQPEFDAMRPVGVTNHQVRIHVADNPIRNDDDFNKLVQDIAKAQDEAIDRVMTCQPDYLVMGISAETFWDGLEASKKLKAHIEKRSKVGVSMGSEASKAALKAYNAKRIAVLTPYQPVGDKNVHRFFTESGFEVKKLIGLKAKSPVLIAHVSEDQMRDSILELNGPDVDAIIQVGTNLAMAKLAASAELWLKKPVIAINTATYWHALRANGIKDKVYGFGTLLTRH
jgi:maleate isomerase